MGTNYYWIEKGICDECGHAKSEELHIGKSSAGWVFSLHIHPVLGLDSLDDWLNLWRSKKDGVIRDEYGQTKNVHEMMAVIMCRFGSGATVVDAEKWFRDNHAVPGPLGLARSKIGSNCIAHGPGAWDYHVGDFS